MNRRGFLGALAGALAAPAVVRAESLMRIIVPAERKIIVPDHEITLDGWEYNEGHFHVHDWYADPFGPRPSRAIIPVYFDYAIQR